MTAPIGLKATNTTSTSAQLSWTNYDPFLGAFVDGSPGGAYVFAPTFRGEQVMFRDTAKTLPVTTDGDKVACVVDLSGNGNDLEQSVFSERPVYKTNGTSHWIESSALGNEFLETGILQITEDWATCYVCEAITWESLAGPWRFRQNGVETGTNANRLEDYSSSLARSIRSRFNKVGTDSARPDTFPAAGVKFVAFANRNVGVEESVGEIYTGSPTALEFVPLPGTTGLSGAGILTMFKGFSGNHLPGKLEAHFFCGRGLTAAERSALVDFMADYSGVSV